MINKLDESEAQTINLLNLLEVIARRKKLVLALCGASLVLSTAYSLTLPDIYSATARVLPPAKEVSGGLSAMLSQMGGIVGGAVGGLGGGTELYVGVLKSRTVADAVIQRLGLPELYHVPTVASARGIVREALKVQVGKEGIISITIEDKDPKYAALIANEFASELGRTLIRLNFSKVGTERIFLEKRLDLVKKDLQKAEDELKSFSKQHKIVQVESQTKATIENIAKVKSELASTEIKLASLRTEQTDESPAVKSLAAQLKMQKSKLAQLAGGKGDGEGIPPLANLPGAGLEYARKLRELKIQEATFEQLTKQNELAKLSEAKDSSSLQVLDDAIVPTGKSKPKRGVIVFVTTVLAFFGSILLALVLEYFKGMSEEDKAIIARIKSHLLASR